MINMKISIIIPTYSPGDYLFACLDSICNQTMNHNLYEIILILNGKKEPYWEKIKNYFNNKDNNFILHYTEKSGVSNARNLGLDIANGEYITFIDDDDIISSCYLEGLLAVSSPTCIGCANCYKFFNNIDTCFSFEWTKTFFKLQNQKFSLWKFRQYLSPPWMKLISRNIIGENRFNTSLCISEDALFCAAISLNISNMKCASENVIYYIREREGSATRKKLKISYIISLTFKKIFLFWKIYFSAPQKYNFLFFISRTLASIKHLKDLLKYAKW